MMKIYYNKDIAFIQEYEKERTGYILQALGINEKQFQHIRYEIIKARSEKAKDIQDIKDKLREVLIHKDYLVCNICVGEKDQRVYREVTYYLNYYTAFYNNQLCSLAGGLMADYITRVLKEKTAELDYIVVPKGSNLLLGIEVGKVLEKPLIVIQERERIYKGKYWDGNYDDSKTNSIIVIHDVLVSGNRIKESIDLLPAGTFNLLGIFCLVKYEKEEFAPEITLKSYDCTLDCIVSVNEDELKNVYDNDW